MKNPRFYLFMSGILLTLGAATAQANEWGLAVCKEFGAASMPRTAKCGVTVKNNRESFIFLPHYLVVTLSKPASVGDTEITGSVSFKLLGTDGKYKYDVPDKGQGKLTITAHEETHGNNQYNCPTQLYSELKLDAGSCHANGTGSVLVSDDGNCDIEVNCLFEK